MEKEPLVGLVFFPAFDWCISPDHPERQERLLYTRDQIQEEGLFDHPRLKEFRPRLAAPEEILRTHVVLPSLERNVTESHRIAAGGTMVAADLVVDGVVDRAFALLRPPGHHANRIVHGARGFCMINNEAIMVDHLRHRLGPDLRIAIVDTDAHHADGTQDIFYNDPGVLHISLHQDGRTLYPGTGFVSERGGPGAYGQTVNIPLPPGTGDQGMLLALEEVVLPILEEWQPDLVINAAGQDNHFSDPITNMGFSAQGYARLTELLKPDVVVLEGGYSIESALPYINVGLLLALAGLDYSRVREPGGVPVRESRDLIRQVAATCREVRELWRTRHEVDLKCVFGPGPFFERHRQIHYDTDQIFEGQRESIRLCSECPGWRLVITASTRSRTPAAAVLLPWKPCERCLGEARAQYEELLEDESFSQVVWQDPSSALQDEKSGRE
ncbi:MAG TPA: histone deacetylase [Firmicutes bacterium]|jgi:acetoin utilization deacetylase AcuC-like enzyme|nr:histone deacetylase [Bacillota bacterium]